MYQMLVEFINANNVTATFVRSPQNVMCPVLSNHLINPDIVHGLLGYCAINFLAPYTSAVSTV